MNISRRGMLIGGGLLVVAPAIVRVASLMPLRGEKLILEPSLEGALLESMRRRMRLYAVDEARNIVTLPTDTPEQRTAALTAIGQGMISGKNQVALDFVDGARVSTVFLGIDRAYLDHVPIVFETMVFGGPCHQDTRRYSTWDEAERGHAEMVALVKTMGGES